MPPRAKTDRHDAWNPGLTSSIPPRLQSAITLYQPGNAYISYDDALEAAQFCGLPVTRMADLTTERMIVHELLVRVTTDLSVPDGPDYETLGLSLRAMVGRIHDGYITPELPRLDAAYQRLREHALQRLEELARQAASPPPEKPGFWSRLIGASPKKPVRLEDTEEAHLATVGRWRDAASAAGDPVEAALYRALAELGVALISHHGRLITDHALMARLSLRLFCHDYGPIAIRALVQPLFTTAARREGYRFLPYQPKRIVMNTKGASAAGKSTIRPKQRELAEKLGIPWADFALISPDYWRKYLLDYDSLGEDYKYAAMLTGHELAMIDQKLDHYMKAKADRDELPHMLIDRFRFDSFTADASGDYQSTLLTRFGDMVFLFFIITPPQETVERAWKRGLKTQRYKAVDDLLYHNREAFTGIPALFFSWMAIEDKTIHFEFLDNDVPLGSPPRTMAFGDNDHMVVLDPVGLGNIDRFREVNIDARQPEAVLHDAPTNYAFLQQCIATIPRIELADRATGQVYGRIEAGRWVSRDDAARPALLDGDPALLSALGSPDDAAKETGASIDLAAARLYTLGQWGEKV